MLNTKILKLEENLISLINESGVPPTVVDLILDRVKNEVTFAVKQVVKQEQQLEVQQHQPVIQEVTPADSNITNINDIVDINLNEEGE